MTKSVYFFLVKTSHLVKKYANLYIQEMVKLYKVFLSNIFDRGTQFASQV